MTLDQLLKDLDARCNGNYYIVRCPECGHHEAYMYVDDIEKHKENPKHKIPIRCNRANKCGKTTYLETVDVEAIPKVDMKKIEIKPLATEKLKILAFHPEFSPEYPQVWRGISAKTMKEHQIIYFDKEWIRFVDLCGDAFPEQYKTKKCYQGRNLIIPIMDYNGNVQRALLRDTKNREHYQKEISVMFIPRSSEVWNKKDIRNDKRFLFITEGVPDALSILEVNPDAGAIAIPGVRKYRQIIRELKSWPESTKKHIVIAFDSDEAGKEYTEKFYSMLKELGCEVSIFPLGEYKDVNDMLQKNRDELEKKVNAIITKSYSENSELTEDKQEELASDGRPFRLVKISETKKKLQKERLNHYVKTKNQRNSQTISRERTQSIQQPRIVYRFTRKANEF